VLFLWILASRYPIGTPLKVFSLLRQFGNTLKAAFEGCVCADLKGGNIVGDLNQIIEKAKGNYLMLYFYLSFWKVNEPLDELDGTRVLKKMYERYLGNATNEPYQDLILKYAALYQYEIEFEPTKKDEDTGTNKGGLRIAAAAEKGKNEVVNRIEKHRVLFLFKTKQDYKRFD